MAGSSKEKISTRQRLLSNFISSAAEKRTEAFARMKGCRHKAGDWADTA